MLIIKENLIQLVFLEIMKMSQIKELKRNILEYAMNNNFDYFVSFTFDDKKIGDLKRTDYKELKKKFLKSLNQL